MRTDEALKLIEEEYLRASDLYPDLHSNHEAYAGSATIGHMEVRTTSTKSSFNSYTTIFWEVHENNF